MSRERIDSIEATLQRALRWIIRPDNERTPNGVLAIKDAILRAIRICEEFTDEMQNNADDARLKNALNRIAPLFGVDIQFDDLETVVKHIRIGIAHLCNENADKHKEIERLRQEIAALRIKADKLEETERGYLEAAEALFRLHASIIPEYSYDHATPGLTAYNIIQRFNETVQALDEATTMKVWGGQDYVKSRAYCRLTPASRALCERLEREVWGKKREQKEESHG